MLSSFFGNHSKIWKHNCWNERQSDGWNSIITKIVIPNMSSNEESYQIKSRWVSIEAYGKKWSMVKEKGSIFQFQVGYMKYPILKKHCAPR